MTTPLDSEIEKEMVAFMSSPIEEKDDYWKLFKVKEAVNDYLVDAVKYGFKAGYLAAHEKLINEASEGHESWWKKQDYPISHCYSTNMAWIYARLPSEKKIRELEQQLKEKDEMIAALEQSAFRGEEMSESRITLWHPSEVWDWYREKGAFCDGSRAFVHFNDYKDLREKLNISEEQNKIMREALGTVKK